MNPPIDWGTEYASVFSLRTSKNDTILVVLFLQPHRLMMLVDLLLLNIYVFYLNVAAVK